MQCFRVKEIWYISDFPLVETRVIDVQILEELDYVYSCGVVHSGNSRCIIPRFESCEGTND